MRQPQLSSACLENLAYITKGFTRHGHLKVKVKVKQSRYRPAVAQRVPGS